MSHSTETSETKTLDEQLAAWDGAGVVIRHDRETGAWIFIALHDDTLGTPTGGTRMRAYPTPAAGLADAQRLAAGMTRKWALIDQQRGGGKAVLALPGEARELSAEDRKGLMRRYGRLVASLAGAYETGPDLGTGLADMLEIAREAMGRVHGVDPERGRLMSTGPYTAAGTFGAVETAAREHLGGSLSGLVVLVEGLGSVGAPLAERLAASGARLKLADLDTERARRLARALGGEAVELDRVMTTPCDLYAPCAVGGTLTAESIEKLPCRAVVGAANNQLATDGLVVDGMTAEARRALGEPLETRLARRGILYAPDFAVNAGGALGFSYLASGMEESRIAPRVEAEIGTLIGDLCRDSKERGDTPLDAAHRRVREALARGRGAREERREARSRELQVLSFSS